MIRALIKLPRTLKTQPIFFKPNPIYFSSWNKPTYFTFSTQPTSIDSQLIEEVETKIYEVLKSAAKCRTEKLARKATFDELGFDSLDTVELVVAFEENLDVNLQDEDAEKIRTVEDAVNVFSKYKAEKLSKTSDNVE